MGWFCSPRGWHLLGSLLRSPTDHLQRPEHPSRARAIPTSQQAQEGLGTAALAAEAGWPSLGYAMTGSPCQVQEPRATWSWWPDGAPWPGGAKPLRDAPLTAQAKCWRWRLWIWGAMVNLASCVGKARPWSAPHIPWVTPHCQHLAVRQRVLRAPQHGRGSVSSYC